MKKYSKVFLDGFIDGAFIGYLLGIPISIVILLLTKNIQMILLLDFSIIGSILCHFYRKQKK